MAKNYRAKIESICERMALAGEDLGAALLEGAPNVIDADEVEKIASWIESDALATWGEDTRYPEIIRMLRELISASPEQIKAARKSSGMTQEQAANVIGATRRAWQEWEGGRRNMPGAKWELFLLKTLR